MRPQYFRIGLTLPAVLPWGHVSALLDSKTEIRRGKNRQQLLVCAYLGTFVPESIDTVNAIAAGGCAVMLVALKTMQLKN